MFLNTSVTFLEDIICDLTSSFTFPGHIPYSQKRISLGKLKELNILPSFPGCDFYYTLVHRKWTILSSASNLVYSGCFWLQTGWDINCYHWTLAVKQISSPVAICLFSAHTSCHMTVLWQMLSKAFWNWDRHIAV